jgi:hypothetical protein
MNTLCQLLRFSGTNSHSISKGSFPLLRSKATFYFFNHLPSLTGKQILMMQRKIETLFSNYAPGKFIQTPMRNGLKLL